MKKILNKVGIEGTQLNIVKSLYDKPTTNIILKSENQKVFPLRPGTKQECILTPLFFNTVLEVLATAVTEEKDKVIQTRKEEEKLPSFADDMILSQFNSVQLLSHVQLFTTPRIAARQTSLSIESVMPLNHLVLCRPLLLLPPIPPSIRVFSKDSALRIRWPKYWSFSFSNSPSNEHPGLISFRMDWLDLLAVHGTLKSILQHHGSKASILRCSAFFTVQLSHPYMTTGKTTALARWIFVGKVMSLLFNILSRLVTTFFPRSKCLLISWLQSPSAVILAAKKIKSDTVSTVSPSMSYEVMGPDAMLVF